MDCIFRPFASSDLDHAVAQATREGWAASRAWFAAILAHDPDLCFVADSAGRGVGMITATAFGASGWVGNLIVDPSHRRRGLGEALMRRALDALDARGIRTLRLDADPPGVNIYRRLGFVDEQRSRRFKLPAPTIPASSGTMSPLRSFEPVAGLDRQTFGDDRARLMSLVLPHAAASLVAGDTGEPRGYAMVIPAGDGVSFGPCVAYDAATASALLRACLAACVGAAVTGGCLEDNPAAAEAFLAMGFRETEPSLRMVRGPAEARGRPLQTFAIASGAVG